jgi:putative DNA methylase
VVKVPKKLIEVALPLDDVNSSASKEKSIRQGHPSTLHLWWARRPLAIARAVIFAQLVNDPGGERGYYSGKTKEQASKEREELFDVIRELSKWQNINNKELLEKAEGLIRKSWVETCELNKGRSGFDPNKLPSFHDPFAGGGAIPLEAQRLGLEVDASDLNPVSVMINKSMIEIPPRFSGLKPVGPLPDSDKQISEFETWNGVEGLAEDVRRYGLWIKNKACERIGDFYPLVEINSGLPIPYREKKPGDMSAPVIAWIWCRTVKSPNPMYSHIDVPLISNFMLSSKKGKETWLEPVISGENYRFIVKSRNDVTNIPLYVKKGTKLGRGASFKCILSDTPIDQSYIRKEFKAKRFSNKLLAVVADSKKGRVYISATKEMEELAKSARPISKPEQEMNQKSKDLVSGRGYGFTKWHELFTLRQLVALETFSGLVSEVKDKVKEDAVFAGMIDDNVNLEVGGKGAVAYSEAIALYLSLVIDKLADYNSSFCGWINKGETLRSTFGRQAIAMVWDYCEANVLGSSTGSFESVLTQNVKSIKNLPDYGNGVVSQSDARRVDLSGKIISTDPPYYDNIAYADLSDFFYIWLRRNSKQIYPKLNSTLVVPKEDELVALSYRHGGRTQAESFFLNGMTDVFINMVEHAHEAFPMTIYYAFKQQSSSEAGVSNAGWETFLSALINAGLSITGTWPMRTERDSRAIGIGTNALASSIVLVCRKRDKSASTISRREFIRELKEVLPKALDDMTTGNHGRSPVAAVDLAQAIIGPGMGVFSKYSSVLEADGSPMSVRTALSLINTYLPGDPDDFDADTRFCLSWFEEYGWSAALYGQADVLARAKGTSVDHCKDAGVLESGSGKVRLFKPLEYPSDWNPEKDNNTPTWEATHQLIRALQSSGESASGALLASMPERSEPIRQLAYRLYTLCERKGWSEDARSYNELINSWAGIETSSYTVGRIGTQLTMEI